MNPGCAWYTLGSVWCTPGPFAFVSWCGNTQGPCCEAHLIYLCDVSDSLAEMHAPEFDRVTSIDFVHKGA